MKKLVFVLTLTVVLCGYSQAIPILAPGDSVIAIDTDPLKSNSSYPAAENPAGALDDNIGTKYLNFGGARAGIVITPGSAAQVQSFVLTTANDAPERDPSAWTLYGTNDPISSGDNSTGLVENWTLVGSGSVSLPDTRQVAGPVVPVSNGASFSSYKLVFDQLKGGAPLMQVADIALYSTNDGSGSNIASGASAIAVQAVPDSRYPGAENPGNIVDGTLAKYLNFGKDNSGFIITPAIGPSVIDSFRITTANDSPERDPLTYELYGTNDAISSEDNGNGNAETWTAITSGFILLPDTRDTEGDIVSFANSDSYTSYKMIFPLVKDSGAANSMQIAEVQFYGVPEPATLALLGFGGLLLRKRRNA